MVHGSTKSAMSALIPHKRAGDQHRSPRGGSAWERSFSPEQHRAQSERSRTHPALCARALSRQAQVLGCA